MLLLVIQQGVENNVSTEDAMKNILTTIRALAAQGCGTLDELDTMVSKVVRYSDSRVDVSKISYLRLRGRLGLFHEKLRDQRQQLTIALTTFNYIANMSVLFPTCLQICHHDLGREVNLCNQNIHAENTVGCRDASISATRQGSFGNGYV